MKAWTEMRAYAFKKAVKELGKLCPENHKAINKRIKAIERSSTI